MQEDNEKKNELDDEIVRIVNELRDVDPKDSKYTEMISNLEKVVKLRFESVKKVTEKWWSKIDPNTVLIASVSLVQVISVLKFEKFDSLTSKAIGFIIKPRH